MSDEGSEAVGGRAVVEASVGRLSLRIVAALGGSDGIPDAGRFLKFRFCKWEFAPGFAHVPFDVGCAQAAEEAGTAPVRDSLVDGTDPRTVCIDPWDARSTHVNARQFRMQSAAVMSASGSGIRMTQIPSRAASSAVHSRLRRKCGRLAAISHSKCFFIL